MSKKFNIENSMLGGLSSKIGDKSKTIKAKEMFPTEYIELEKIKSNPNNIYNIENIEALAEKIKLFGLTSLTVRPLKDGNYELIGGHRRYAALKMLVNRGEKEFNIVPCQVKENLSDDINSRIALIIDNSQTRERTEQTKSKEVDELEALYKAKKARGEKLNGTMREAIARDLNLSPSQVGKYQQVNKKLIHELKKLFFDEKLIFSNAFSFSALSSEKQLELYNQIKDQDVQMTKEEAEQKVKEIKAQEAAAEESKKVKISSSENVKINSEIETGLKDVISKIQLIKERSSEIKDKKISATDENRKLYKEYKKLTREIEKILKGLILE